jgi:hypothetical protein
MGGFLSYEHKNFSDHLSDYLQCNNTIVPNANICKLLKNFIDVKSDEINQIISKIGDRKVVLIDGQNIYNRILSSKKKCKNLNNERIISNIPNDLNRLLCKNNNMYYGRSGIRFGCITYFLNYLGNKLSENNREYYYIFIYLQDRVTDTTHNIEFIDDKYVLLRVDNRILTSNGSKTGFDSDTIKERDDILLVSIAYALNRNSKEYYIWSLDNYRWIRRYTSGRDLVDGKYIKINKNYKNFILRDNKDQNLFY